MPLALPSWRHWLCCSAIALLVTAAGCAAGEDQPEQRDSGVATDAALDHGRQQDTAITPPDDGGAADAEVDGPGAIDTAPADAAPPSDAEPPSDAAAQTDVMVGLLGDTCANAQPVTAGTLTGQTTIGLAADYTISSACMGYASRGLDRVYSITVAAGQTLTVLVHPTTTSWDPQVYLLDGPATACSSSATCLAGADNAYAGQDETFSWTNSGATRMVFIVVDYYLSADTGGNYDLTVTLS